MPFSLRLNTTSLVDPAVEDTSATSLPMAGPAFVTAAAELVQGLSLEQIRSYLITLGLPLEEIENCEFEDMFAGLTFAGMNPGWYLNPFCWQGDVLPGAIPAIPFAENYPGRDNHLDLLKAHLFVWNVMHSYAVNAHAEGDWAYKLVGAQGQVLDGETLRHEYNNLSPAIKAVLDQSCNVTFPDQLADSQQKAQVWPDHERYGKHMGFSVFVLAKLISTGQVLSFNALWYLARELRVAAPNFGNNLIGLDNIAFRSSRFPKTTSKQLGSEYILLPKFEQNRLSTALSGISRYSSYRERFENLGIVEYLVPGFKKPVTLTQYWNKPINTEPNAKTCPRILHTQSRFLQRVLIDVEGLYLSILVESPTLKDETANPPQLFSTMAEFFWLVAHACFDARGSAAKSDLCLRALYLALFNKPLPAWMPGFVPDLEAMLCENAEAFECKINTEAFAAGLNWDASLTHLSPVFPEAVPWCWPQQTRRQWPFALPGQA